jgi:hypothetical protein
MNRAALVCGCLAVVVTIAWFAAKDVLATTDSSALMLAISTAVVAGLTLAGALLLASPRRPRVAAFASAAAIASAFTQGATTLGAIGWAEGIDVGDGLPGDAFLAAISNPLILASVPLGVLTISLVIAAWLPDGRARVLVPVVATTVAIAASLPITPAWETTWMLGFMAANLNVALILAVPVCAVIVIIIAAARLYRSSRAPLPASD